MDIDLGQRLKAYRQKANVSMTDIAIQTGISRENLYKWERGSKPSNINDYIKLKSFLDKKEKLENIINSIPDPSQITANTLRLPLDTGKKSEYDYKAQSPAGTIVFTDDQPELIVERIDAPFLRDVEGLLEINDDSMAPTITPGSRIAVARIKYSHLLQWGMCYYLIDKNWHGMVRRIYPLSDVDIKLIADHADQTKYPPFSRSWNDIAAIFKIIAVIRRL